MPDFPSKVPSPAPDPVSEKTLDSPAAPLRRTQLGSNEAKDRPKAEDMVGNWPM